MKKLFLAIALAIASFASAQAPQYGRFHKSLFGSAAPSTTCTDGTLYFASSTNQLFVCKSTAWLRVVGSDIADSRSGAGSYQTLAIDTTFAAAAGTSDVGDSDFLAPAMFNVFNTNASKTKNYWGAVIGHYNISGTNASTYPTGAFLAGIGDGTTTADGAVVAYIDGDGSVTTAGAAFKVMNNNSTVGSGFNYGLDLADASHDGFDAVAYNDADIRLSNNAHIFTGASTTRAALRTEVNAKVAFANVAIGSLYLSTAGKLYLKTANADADTDWERVSTSAAD